MPSPDAHDAHHSRASAEPPNRPGRQEQDAHHAHAERHIDCGAADPGPPRQGASCRGPGSRRFGDGHEGARHVREPAGPDGTTYR